MQRSRFFFFFLTWYKYVWEAGSVADAARAAIAGFAIGRAGRERVESARLFQRGRLASNMANCHERCTMRQRMGVRNAVLVRDKVKFRSVGPQQLISGDVDVYEAS
jgi:hypothetical protein